MRKYYLEANNGLRYDLTNKECFFNTPSGLGFDYNSTYSNVGDYFIRNNNELSQKIITGEIVFSKNFLSKYQEFINFANSYNNYKLIYLVDNTEYLIDVDLRKIEKSDTNSKKYLGCNIEFVAKSLFYKRSKNVYILKSTDNQNRWDMTFDFRFDDDVKGDFEFINTGHIPCGWDLKIEGNCIDPLVKILDNKGNEKEIQFTINLAAGDSIFFSTVDNNLACQKTINGITSNAFDIISFSDDNFVKIEKGYNKISILEDIPSATLTTYEIYITV